MSLSNFMEWRMLSAFFDLTALPSSLGDPHWVGLCTAAPFEDESELFEVSGNNYGRVATYATDWNEPAFDTNGHSFVSNKNIIVFPEASGSWGTITAFGLFSMQTSGILYMYGVLTDGKPIILGSIPKFVEASLKVYLS